MSALSTLLDPSRAAHASIRGYLYQAWLGVERGLELGDDEVLRCEGDEDLDRLLRDGSGSWSEQVKAYTGKINGTRQGEGVQLLAPFLFLYPQAFEGLMGALVRDYRRHCAEADREPDLEFRVPSRRFWFI
jgi:hypothetical protein